MRDLHRIRDFIARDNPHAAVTFCQTLLDHAERLSQFPERGGRIAERLGARFLVVGPYLIIYRIDETRSLVRVLRFWHGAREREGLHESTND